MISERDRIREDLERCRLSYPNMSDDEIRADMLLYKPNTPVHEAAKLVLAERAAIKDPTRKAVLDLANRIANMEQLAATPAYKTSAFWLSVIAIVVAVVSWVK